MGAASKRPLEGFHVVSHGASRFRGFAMYREELPIR